MTFVPVNIEDHDALLKEMVKTMSIDELLELLQACVSIPNEVQAQIVRDELKTRQFKCVPQKITIFICPLFETGTFLNKLESTKGPLVLSPKAFPSIKTVVAAG